MDRIVPLNRPQKRMGLQHIKSATLPNIGLLLSIIALGSPTSAQLTILDTDFIAAEGYVDGDLQFQSIDNGTAGTWLGNLGAIVNSGGTGTVSRTSNPGRVLFQKGATGGVAGGNGDGETAGAGFTVGDLVRIEHAYAFAVASAENVGLLQTGFRPNFVTGGLALQPEIGLNIDYRNDGEGTVKIFSNMSRSGFASTDDPFAFEIGASNLGIDNGSDGGAVDLQSDPLKLTWEAEFLGNDTWQTNEITIQNLETNFVSSASVEHPNALESVSYHGAGAEAFFAMQQLQGFSGIGVTDTVAFRYTSVSNDLAGDFDTDGDIDGADLLRWQHDGLGISDVLLWMSNYGISSSGMRGIGNPVPEASTIALCAIGVTLGARPVSRRRAISNRSHE